jgi:hypothetical protein
MKSWNEFKNQNEANCLSGISYTVNRLKSVLNEKDYEALAGDVLLLKNLIMTGKRHSRFEDISNLKPMIFNLDLELQRSDDIC